MSKLFEVPTTGLFGFLHRHWNGFLALMVVAIAIACWMRLNFETIHRHISHWIYGTPL
jgi:hypothetical protein